MDFPSRFSRLYVLDRVRRIALHALSNYDMKTWRRCAALLDREAKRKFGSYTAQREELADAR